MSTGLSACGDGGSPACAEDAGTLSTVVEVAEAAECQTQRLAVPASEALSCGGLPSASMGGRVRMRAHPGTAWSLDVERTDGAPLATCAAVIDPCRCHAASCTDERYLPVDLGSPAGDFVDVALPAGTYMVTLCGR